MNITEAISILKIHQEWRLGADIVSIEPKELTEAMQVVVDHHSVDVNKMVSSVECLFEEFLKHKTLYYLDFNKAKAMHKVEIINANWEASEDTDRAE